MFNVNEVHDCNVHFLVNVALKCYANITILHKYNLKCFILVKNKCVNTCYATCNAVASCIQMNTKCLSVHTVSVWKVPSSWFSKYSVFCFSDCCQNTLILIKKQFEQRLIENTHIIPPVTIVTGDKTHFFIYFPSGFFFYNSWLFQRVADNTWFAYLHVCEKFGLKWVNSGRNKQVS